MDIKLNNVSKLFNPGKTNEYIAINNISLEIKKVSLLVLWAIQVQVKPHC